MITVHGLILGASHRATTAPGPSWWPSGPTQVISEGSSALIFYLIFPEIFGALLMAGKPEIQKQQKTITGSWVHWVNRLVQICSKVYESSIKTWQSHTKDAWSKQKL